jgi:hypothetical protein
MTGPVPPGRTASVIDTVTAGAAFVTAALAVGGPYRGVIAGTPVSIGWMHAAFAAAALAAIRHAAIPRPTVLASIQHWRAWLERRPALHDAVLATLAIRLPIVLVGLLATATIGLPVTGADGSARGPTRALAARWDAQWYAGIAAHGYEWQHSFNPQQNLAFFPAFPLLIRGVGAVTGAFADGVPEDKQIVRLTWCGLAIALAAFLWAAWYFGRIAREMMDEPQARAGLWILAAYPFAIFYSASYTESLFLLAALGTWFHFRHDHMTATVGWGLLAGLTRPNGCFLSIPLGLLALGVRDGGAVPRSGVSWRRLMLAAMPGVGMLLFTLYAHQLTGVWFAWARTHAAWGRVVGSESPLAIFAGFGPGGLAGFAADHPYDLLNGLGLLFAVALAPAVWRLSPAWAVFVLTGVLVPLSAGGLLSMGRLTSTLFPLFLAAALVVPAGGASALVTGFALMQGLLAALFYTWRDVY